jgi:hypothetical protein
MDELTGWQDDIQPQQILARHSILEGARTAGIVCHVATDTGLLQAGWIRRVEQSLCFHGTMEIVGNDAGFENDEKIDGIYLQNQVHASHRQDDAAGNGDCASGIADAASP